MSENEASIISPNQASIENVKDETNTIVNSFLTNNSNPAAIEPTQIEYNSTEYSKIIANLHIEVDKSLKITRYNVDTQLPILGLSKGYDSLLIRDARNADQSKKPEDIVESFVISMAHTARAAEKMIEISNLTDKPEKTKKIREIFASEVGNLLTKKESGPKEKVKYVRSYEEQIFDQLDGTTIDTLTFNKKKNFLGRITDRISGSTGKDLGKFLTNLREFQSLYEDQPHLATIWQGKDNDTITTVSARIAPNSQEQIQEFRSIKDNSNRPKWYNNLKSEDKILVDKNIDKLIEGNKTIPTSLRFIPGLRNSYYEMDLVTNGSGTTIFNQNIRTATLAYYSGQQTKEEKQRVTYANLTHLDNLVKIGTPERKLELQIYNYKLPIEIGEETKISNLIGKAVADKNTDITLHQIPIALYYNKDKAIDEIIHKISANVIRVKSCKSGKDRTAAGLMFDKLNSYFMKQKLEDKQEQDTVAQNYVRSYHAETISGGYGGSHGALGLKTTQIFKYLGLSGRFGKYEAFNRKEMKNSLAGLNSIPESTKTVSSSTKSESIKSIESLSTEQQSLSSKSLLSTNSPLSAESSNHNEQKSVILPNNTIPQNSARAAQIKASLKEVNLATRTSLIRKNGLNNPKQKNTQQNNTI